MRFGLRLIEYVGDTRELVRLAALAEAAGFDSVWFPHDPFMRNTWVLTTATAAATSRIEIGSVGTNPYTTGPSEIATYAATLDELSGGRFILGLGLHTEKMVAWTGYDSRNYQTATKEAVQLIRRLLRGDVVEFEGDVYSWSDQCYLRFEPLRKNIPIYVCAFGEPYLALSGEIGDGSLPMMTPPEAASYMVPAIRQGLNSNDDPDHFVISGCAWLSLSESRQAAADNMRKMIAYFGPYLEDDALATIGLGADDFGEIGSDVTRGDYDAAYAKVNDDMLRLGVVGAPNDVIERIELMAAHGVNEFNLGGPLGPDPEKAIRLMGERVIPHFRATVGVN